MHRGKYSGMTLGEYLDNVKKKPSLIKKIIMISGLVIISLAVGVGLSLALQQLGF